MTKISFDTLATTDILKNAEQGLAARGFTSESVANGAEALERIKTLIPAGASVMNGASRTLEQIGFIDYLKVGAHNWNNLHAGIVAEKDPAKQSALRKQATLSDYYLGSVHAVTEEGEIVVVSNTGSQMPHLVFTSPNLILVVGTQKIVLTLSAAFERVENHVLPLENENMKQKYGIGTARNKTLILSGENPRMGRKVHIIFVNEKLGF
jgi:hypothetical protein